MLVSPTRKNKIDLSDYDYQRDIDNRLQMAHFTTFDVEVLEEVLNSSLKFSISDIAEFLEAPQNKVLDSLTTLSKTGLLTIQNEKVSVNKEMRKYYDSQISKFDDNFRPDMDFLQALLKKVPIHVLPTWYSLPRASNNIFESILEKHLQTPKVYTRYLQELQFEDDTLIRIIDDVFQAPDFKVRSRDLRQKYDLSRKQFEHYMLHLEFNFVCCLSYNQIGENWKEVVTPFQEWRDYLRFLNREEPTPPSHPQDLTSSSITEIAKILNEISEQPTDVSKKDRFIQKICELNLASLENSLLSPSFDCKEWLEMPEEDRCMWLFRHPRNYRLDKEYPSSIHSDRNVRRIEKNLSYLTHSNWIVFEDFFTTLPLGIGTTLEPTLFKKKRQWQYHLPEHNEDEKQFIKSLIFDRLFLSGIVNIAVIDGKECFHLTDAGHVILGTNRVIDHS